MPFNETTETEKQYPWDDLKGMTEEQAEDHMLKHWKIIPQWWFNPIFRDSVTGVPGQAELSANMDQGIQAYSKTLGKDAAGILYQRNIAGQGHPAEKDWREAQTRNKKQ